MDGSMSARGTGLGSYVNGPSTPMQTMAAQKSEGGEIGREISVMGKLLDEMNSHLMDLSNRLQPVVGAFPPVGGEDKPKMAFASDLARILGNYNDQLAGMVDYVRTLRNNVAL